MNLLHTTALVTGSSDGIGKQIALQLAKQKVQLALLARDTKRLEDVKKEALANGSAKVEIYPCDLKNTTQLESTVIPIVQDFKHINILINNAGIWQKKMQVDEISQETIDDVINSNLTSHIHLTRLILPYLRKEKEAAIINVISKSGVVAQEGQSVYTASKYGMMGFTEVLKQDLKNSHIRVAGIYHSGTNTNMFAKVGEKVPNEIFINPMDLADLVVCMLTRPQKIWIHDVRIDY